MLVGALVASLVTVSPAFGQATAEPYAPPPGQEQAAPPQATPTEQPATGTGEAPPPAAGETPTGEQPPPEPAPEPTPEPEPAPVPEPAPGPYVPPTDSGPVAPPSSTPIILIPVDVPVAARPDLPTAPPPVLTTPGGRPDTPTAVAVPTTGRDATGGDTWTAPSVPVVPDTPVVRPAAKPVVAPVAPRATAAPVVQRLNEQDAYPAQTLIRGPTEQPLAPQRIATSPERTAPAVTVVSPRAARVADEPLELTSPPYTPPSRDHASLLEILAGYAFPGAGSQSSGAILLLFPLALLLAALTPRIPRLHLQTIVAARGAGSAGYRAVALRPG